MLQPVVILASSRKNGGVCLAGKCLGRAAGEWVRPVSIQPGQAWSVRSLHCVAGGVPQIGDRLLLPLIDRQPVAYQHENCSVRFERWQSTGRLGPADILPLADTPTALWLDGWHSKRGMNDRIPMEIAAQHCKSSLLLIRPDALRIKLDQNDCELAVRAQFDYRGQHYNLKISDPVASSLWIERLADGHSGRADALLTISLAQPYYGFCYKVVASVIELTP